MSLTIAALFGLEVWLTIPHSVKWIAELFQLLLLCHLCVIFGRNTAIEWLKNNYWYLLELMTENDQKKMP